MDVEQKMELELVVTIIRCGCGMPGSHKNQVCPRPRIVENLGEPEDIKVVVDRLIQGE